MVKSPLADISIDSRPVANAIFGTAWLRVLRETYGFVPCSFNDTEGNTLPMMEVNSPITGRRGVSLPFTDEVNVGAGRDSRRAAASSPAMTDSPASRVTHAPSLFDMALTHGRKRNWKYIELRGGDLPNAQPSCSFHGHALDLACGEVALFNGLEGSVRRAIRKAEKAGVHVEISNELRMVKAYYALHCKTRRKHGLPPQPWSFFDNIHKHMLATESGMVVLASIDGKNAAGALFLHAASEALYKFGASDEQFQAVRPNNLVMWEAIKWYAARGFDTLRFGRTDIGNEGLRHFKQQWGATEYPIHYWRYDLRQGRFAAHTHAVIGWHNSVFRIMPSSIAKIAGALLYKHVA